MKKKEWHQLFEKYQAGKCTPSEAKMVEDFLQLFQNPENDWDSSIHGKKEEVGRQIFDKVKDKLEKYNRPTVKFKTRIYRYAAIVSFLLVAFLAHHYLSDKSKDSEIVTVAKITKVAKVGQKLTFKLSDGTIVRLNSSSKLTFPEQFDSISREVRLEGEGYFEVVKKTRHPFKVVTGNIITTALGTSFNIKAYSTDRDIDVSLASGSVRIEQYVKNNLEEKVSQMLLKPGENVVYSLDNNHLQKGTFDLAKVLAWKDNILYFDDVPFDEMIKTLERWYGVEITVSNRGKGEMKFSGKFEQESLQHVLEAISYAKKFDFQIKDKTVVINF